MENVYFHANTSALNHFKTGLAVFLVFRIKLNCRLNIFGAVKDHEKKTTKNYLQKILLIVMFLPS